ncbi:hypothetical protein HP398_02795 [Brevibacillus sp. HB1.4B]|uniref:hypothetical protein n=1 Tax=unclassified Brevibacillus TaxID=2684853 RepID=UPI00156AA694|nr:MULTISPECIES: hypothetical protein [unclassified Brevibacillus]NRS15362.1 hypothetical protein [Brevibacillus sp. HB1.4B]NTU29789.1 hypothetical protein [Brevibacillus sp. HB1.1]
MHSPLFPFSDPAKTRFDTELFNGFDRKIRKEKVASCLIIQDGYLAYEQGLIADLETPIYSYFPFRAKNGRSR